VPPVRGDKVGRFHRCVRKTPIDAAPNPVMSRRRESAATDVIPYLDSSLLPVENQDLRERLTFPVCTLVGDG